MCVCVVKFPVYLNRHVFVMLYVIKNLNLNLSFAIYLELQINRNGSLYLIPYMTIWYHSIYHNEETKK